MLKDFPAGTPARLMQSLMMMIDSVNSCMAVSSYTLQACLGRLAGCLILHAAHEH